MNYSNIRKFDIANGDGIRVSIWVSGCDRGCPECFNEELWDFDAGQPYTHHTEETIMQALSADWIQGLTILGGEPLHDKNREEVYKLARKVKKRFPEKDVWVYTGKTLTFDEVKSYTPFDVIVDGDFRKDKKVIDLRFRGSTNQRIIDVKKSIENKKITLWSDIAV